MNKEKLAPPFKADSKRSHHSSNSELLCSKALTTFASNWYSSVISRQVLELLPSHKYFFEGKAKFELAKIAILLLTWNHTTCNPVCKQQWHMETKLCLILSCLYPAAAVRGESVVQKIVEKIRFKILLTFTFLSFLWVLKGVRKTESFLFQVCNTLFEA